jgi:hypothetical protein
MNESALERIRWESREKEVERKAKAYGKEQIEKEKVERIRLIGVIYVESFPSSAPTIEEIIIFEQE